MQDLLNEVKIAVGYHAKSTINKYDILFGDERLLGLIIDNLNKKIEYDTLRENAMLIIESKLAELNLTTVEYDLVSSVEKHTTSEVEIEIDKAIINILNQIENDFVRNEVIRMARAPKKMLRAKMFLKVSDKQDFEHAALIELFHLATLIQDDVIDMATMRRHTKTINHLHGDQAAILVSDYLLVHIGYMIGQFGNQNKSEVEQTDRKIQDFYQDLIKDFLKSLLYSEREVDNVNDNLSYNSYASNKTAKFFKVALISGKLVNDRFVSIEKLKQVGDFGQKFGLIFQKVDDLLDYQADVSVSGKDSRDFENDINNYILINLKELTISQIKKGLEVEALALQKSHYGAIFEEEINYLIRRINE